MFMEERFLKLDDLCRDVSVGRVADRELGKSLSGISIVGTRESEFLLLI